jgi:type IV pilus assembly protein PilA
MVNKMKAIWKNQKGLTLIELLAVIIILGIIAAIAVPSIGGIIDNTRNDAHVANGQQMINAARLAQASNNNTSANDDIYTLQELIDDDYLEDPTNPDYSAGYHLTGSFVQFNKTATGSGKFTVTLKQNVASNPVIYINAKTSKELTEEGRDALSN